MEALVKLVDYLMNCVEKPMILVENVYEKRIECMDCIGHSCEFCIFVEKHMNCVPMIFVEGQ